MNKRAALLAKLQTAVGDAVEKSFVSKRTGDVYRQILQVLPADAAFVDIVKLSDQKASGQEAPGQYIAFVAKPGQAQPILVKLGDAKAIEALVTAYQTTVRVALDAGELPDEQTLNAIGRKLHQQIITPLAAHIAGAGRLVISPDAALQLIPFEVLVSAEGRFLLQDVAVSYVTSGIDLLRPKLAREQIKTALVVAAPQYSATVEDSAKSRKTDALIPTRKKARLAFTPLDDTQEEATAVATILASKQVTATTLLAKDASKSAILGRDAPHLLHIATHGFFLNDQGQASPLISEKAGSSFEVQLIKQGSSPMNRAGLALAGANTNQREGILYAAEIAGLDLRKINMAVLSACDTGVGDLESGDGVYGLRRAFMTAGASNVVTSLWPVASEETTEFMKAFYTALFSSSSNPDALRVSKIQLMKKYPNPYLWGAFVLAGN
jgi:CHAT domain-containing protein